MKIKKRTLVLILTIAMAMALAGCESAATDKKQEPAGNTEADSVNEMDASDGISTTDPSGTDGQDITEAVPNDTGSGTMVIFLQNRRTV